MYFQASEALQHLQSSNIVPKSCEAASVQAHIDDLASKICQTRLQLAELEDQYRLHKAILSPVRRMPKEIIGEIFKFVLPKVLDQDDRKSLVNLLLVCKSWRDTGLLTNIIWSGLSFDKLGRTVPCDKIGNWFKRAGKLSKSLEIVTPYHEDCANEDSICHSFNSTLATLLTKGTDLKHFTLECASLRCIQRFMDSLAIDNALAPRPTPWDSLLSFSLRFTKTFGDDDSPLPLKTIFSTLPPNIVSLELSVPDTFADLSPTPSPERLCYLPPAIFQQLTSLTLRCDWGGPRWLAKALEHCINVQSLTLDFGGYSWNYEEDADTERYLQSGILLPNVRTLRLQNASGYSMDVLDYLEAPKLVDLDLDFSPEDASDDLDWQLATHVLEFVERSECDKTLRFFHLRYVDMYAEELLTTLNGLPFLAHVTLEHVVASGRLDYRDCIFDLLTRPMSGYDKFLPSLESLELLELPPDSREFGWGLCHYLRSRRRYGLQGNVPVFEDPPDTLKSLTVTYRVAEANSLELDTSQTFKFLKRWCGVSVNIGPVLATN